MDTILRLSLVPHHGVHVQRQRGTLPRQGFLRNSALICDEKETAGCHTWREVRLLLGAHDI